MYTVVFQELRAKVVTANTEFNPGAIMSDYETRVIQAVAACFPQAHPPRLLLSFTQVGTVDIHGYRVNKTF